MRLLNSKEKVRISRLKTIDYRGLKEGKCPKKDPQCMPRLGGFKVKRCRRQTCDVRGLLNERQPVKKKIRIIINLGRNEENKNREGVSYNWLFVQMTHSRSELPGNLGHYTYLG